MNDDYKTALKKDKTFSDWALSKLGDPKEQIPEKLTQITKKVILGEAPNTDISQDILAGLENFSDYRRIRSWATEKMFFAPFHSTRLDDLGKSGLKLVQDTIRQIVGEKITDKKRRDYILNKVSTVKLEMSYCMGGPTDVFEKGLDRLTYTNAGYKFREHTIKFCTGEFIRNTSLFNLLATLAHEVSHAIDPCHLQNYKFIGFGKGKGQAHLIAPFAYSAKAKNDTDKALSEFPFSKAVQCLARPDGLNARPLRLIKSNRHYQGYDNTVLCNHQIGEAFADLMSAEVIGRISPILASDNSHRIAGITNIFRQNCPMKDSKDDGPFAYDVHPKTKDRPNFIYRHNSAIRKALGCSTLQVEDPLDCLGQ